MRRPRHREKSNLLWKMLGIAAAINLILWPVLIHEGVFAGIRQEVLVPVRLIPAPPSHKPPDALQRVARTPTVAKPSAPTVSHPSPPRIKPSSAHVAAVPLVAVKRRPPTVAAVPEKLPAAAPAHKHPQATAQKPISKPPSHMAKRTPSSPHRPKPHPAQVAQAKHPAPISHSNPDVHDKQAANAAQPIQPTLAARLKRAKRLEAEGHQVAEWITQQRAARIAALPPPVATAGTDGVTETKETTIVPNEEPPPPQKLVSPASVGFVPAVSIWKVHPTVPDSMMNSSWHATFHGCFTVHKDGTTTVEMVSSTGFPVLDRRALEAARQWKFQPARMDGAAVVSSQPFAFEYSVHAVR